MLPARQVRFAALKSPPAVVLILPRCLFLSSPDRPVVPVAPPSRMSNAGCMAASDVPLVARPIIAAGPRFALPGTNSAFAKSAPVQEPLRVRSRLPVAPERYPSLSPLTPSLGRMIAGSPNSAPRASSISKPSLVSRYYSDCVRSLGVVPVCSPAGRNAFPLHPGKSQLSIGTHKCTSPSAHNTTDRSPLKSESPGPITAKPASPADGSALARHRLLILSKDLRLVILDCVMGGTRSPVLTAAEPSPAAVA